jgi:hypothetical protein
MSLSSESSVHVFAFSTGSAFKRYSDITCVCLLALFVGTDYFLFV